MVEPSPCESSSDEPDMLVASNKAFKGESVDCRSLKSPLMGFVCQYLMSSNEPKDSQASDMREVKNRRLRSIPYSTTASFKHLIEASPILRDQYLLGNSPRYDIYDQNLGTKNSWVISPIYHKEAIDMTTTKFQPMRGKRVAKIGN